jgi:hypothetical protein
MSLFIGYRIMAFAGRSKTQMLSLIIRFYKYLVIIASFKISLK